MIVLQLASECPEGLLNNPPGNTPTAPAAPSALTATAFSATQINLAWTDNSSNEDGFRIERAPGGTTTFAEVGTVAAGITAYQNTGLTSSTAYSYRVRAYNATGNSAYSATAAATTMLAVPTAPSNLLASGVSSSQVNVTWIDNSSNEVGFKIEQSTNGSTGPFTEIATVGAGVTGYQSTGLQPSTAYTYRARSYNAAGNSGYSNNAVGFTSAPPATPPAAPTNLVATGVSASQIDLSWTDNSNNETGFKIERCAGASCSNFSVVATVNANVTTHQMTGLAAGTYSVRVYGYNGAGASGYSLTVTASTSGGGGTPAAPSSLVAAVASSTQINLSWTDNATDETGFTIERCEGSSCSNFAEITTVAAGVVSYQNTGLTPSTPYSYRVRAYNGAGNSVFSNTASASTSAGGSPPAAPTNLQTVIIDATQMSLTWNHPSTDEDGFKVERSTDNVTFAQIGTAAAGAGIYNDNGLTASTTYYYRVRAYNSVGNSAYSNVANGATTPNPPPAPGALVLTPISTSRINLGWTDLSSNETGFQVDRAPGGTASFVMIALLGPDANAFQDSLLTAATSYTYRVRAFNAGGYSGSIEATASTQAGALPAAPTLLAAAAASSAQINLTWTDNSNNEDGFKIERCTGVSCSDFAEITTVAAGVDNYQSTGLSEGTTYGFRVRAYNGAGNSGYSNTASVATETPLPTLPGNLVATAASTSQINLTWDDWSTNETGFKIERCTGAACSNFAEITQVGAGVVSYPNTGLSAATLYRYRVRAYNLGGNSSYSNEAEATTQGGSPPAAPSGLTVTTPAVAGQLNLAWTDNSADEAGFHIERAPGGTPDFVEITTVGAGVTAYQNTSLAAATGYSYRVRAYNAGGNSGYTSTASGTTLPAPPVAPSVLTATVISTSQVSLAWLDNSANEDGFKIERCTGVGCSSFAEIGTVGVGITQAQNFGLPASTAFRYRVRAYNSGGNSLYSNEVAITTTLTPPAAPSNLTAVGISTSVIYIQWVDNSLNEDAFHVEQSTNGGAYVDLSAPNGVPAGTYGANITGLTAGNTYTYRIRARNAAGYSAYTNTASAMPTEPSQLTAYPDADNLLAYYTADASKGNTVFPTGENAVGCNFVLGQFALAYFCTSTAFQFSTLQAQIAGRTITSAVLRLYPSSLAGNFNTVYATNAIAQAWSPSTITWNNQPTYYTGNQSNQLPPQSGTPVDFNVTAIVQNWANGSWANNGILLRDLTVYPGTSMVQLTGFWSMDYYSNAAYRPQLIITF